MRRPHVPTVGLWVAILGLVMLFGSVVADLSVELDSIAVVWIVVGALLAGFGPKA